MVDQRADMWVDQSVGQSAAPKAALKVDRRAASKVARRADQKADCLVGLSGWWAHSLVARWADLWADRKAESTAEQ